MERPSNTDILLLRNGDKLTGTILNESFSIRTSYAQLKFNNRMIAGIDLEGGDQNIESIVTVNNNRFSGFIDDPFFVFKLQTGAQIKVRREKVLKAIFRVREAERRGIPQRQFVLLKNGDYFSGKIMNDQLVVATTYAKVPLALKDADTITLIGKQTPLTKVVMLNGDILQGVLETEDIKIQLDVGTEIAVYKDRIDKIYCRDGYVPDLAQIRSGVTVVALSSAVDDYDSVVHRDYFLVKTVPKSSQYYGKLRPGDKIIAVDGVPYSNIPEKTYKGHGGRLTPMLWELLDGKRSQIILTVVRGEEKFKLKLIKK